jgi:penicillin-binding protein, 1A family
MNYGKKGISQKQKKLSSVTPRLGKKFSFYFLKFILIGIITLAIIGTNAGFGLVNGIIVNSPNISSLQLSPTATASFIYDGNGNQIQKLNMSTSNRIYVTIDQIPQYLQDAVVATEDERFYQHQGIDIRGIGRAIFVNVTSGGISEGASTITQQLLKNNVFTNWTQESSVADQFERKFQEQYLALEYEKHVSKSEILEYYLNTINLGSGAYGVQAASHRYFNKDVWDLTLSEVTVIAGITQNPSAYDPIYYPEYNRERRIDVLNHMLRQGYISQAEYDDSLADNVYERIQTTAAHAAVTSVYSYYIDEVIDQVIHDLQTKLGYTATQAYRALYSGGLQVYTPQNMDIQRIVDEEFNNPANFPEKVQWYMEYALSITRANGSVEHFSSEMLKTHFREHDLPDFDLLFDDQALGKEYIDQYKADIMKEGDTVLSENTYYAAQPQASAAIIDQHTGYVVALAGGRGKKEASLVLNRATDTTRQPGSTFKIISTYAPAIDVMGMTLSTVYENEKYAYSNGVEVRNWNSDTTMYSGLTTIRKAIEESSNIVAVKVLTDITPQLGYDYCLNFGITTLVNRNEVNDGDIIQPLSLGGITNGVTNVELTAAYAAIANSGTYVKPIYYTKILDHEGNVLLENRAETSTVIKDTTAFLMTSAMQDVVTYGTAYDVRLGDMPVAGKTGTTSDSKDIWFSGYTPYYTCSIWGGFDNNIDLPESDIYQTYNRVLWKTIMNRIHEDLPVIPFAQPETIVTASTCKKSGKLAVPGLCDHDPRGTQIYTEYYTVGTEPKVPCTTHVLAEVCTTSNALSSAYCPTKTSKIFMNNPRANQNVTDDTQYQVPKNICSVHTKPKETEAPPISTPTPPVNQPTTTAPETEPPTNSDNNNNSNDSSSRTPNPSVVTTNNNNNRSSGNTTIITP